jgi:acetoin utilization deacetylase AcuC-like enzyme
MSSGLDIVPLVAPEATVDMLAAVHDPGYIERIERFCRAGGGDLDPDTFAVAESWEAALHSAGAGPAAAQALLRGEADTAFIATRPPGHHAVCDQAMGFCLFNNIAITAMELLERGDRVAVVDWDVHHGNGTQDTFYADPRLLYISLHEFPAYPGTGWVAEDGEGPGAGFTVNLPMPSGTEGGAYRNAFRRVVLPVLRQFQPDWILVSNGYDAHAADPLAGIRLVEDDYFAMSAALRAVVPTNRVIFFLEGGYDLPAMRDSAAATLQGLASSVDPDEAVADGLALGSSGQLLRAAFERAELYWELG